MKKVVTVFGTRPEAIKMAPVIRELEQHPGQIISRVCVTAQHREMLDQVLSLFQITPDYDLNLMHPGQSLNSFTGLVFSELDSILEAEAPDWVLVQGDTTTVMAASVAAFYRGIRVGHIEAGLRTFNKWQPYPEEVNRKIAGVVADIHFAPTAAARQNLLREGVDPDAIYVTGNPVVDALHLVADMPYDLENGPLAGVPWDRRILLVTAHRRENFGAALVNICDALREIASCYQEDVQIIYPVHLNPNVQIPVRRMLSDISNVTLLPPLDYLPMVHLMKRAYLVLTDSGGIQEEAPGLGKPVLIFRETTERPEAVDVGAARLVGTDPATIVSLTRRLLDHPIDYQSMARIANLYGDGQTARRIVSVLLSS